MRIVWRAVVASAVMLLGACTIDPGSDGREIEAPIGRSFYWYRYIGGADIRDACAAGAPDRTRIVYNAVWGEQVRIYDIVGPRMMARVLTDMSTGLEIDISAPDDLLGPWKTRRGDRVLNNAELSQLDQALAASGGLGPPPAGRNLLSEEFWWSVASCRNGRWSYAAYDFQTDGFRRVRFAEALFALDPLAQTVPPPPPRKTAGERYGPAYKQTHSKWRALGGAANGGTLAASPWPFCCVAAMPMYSGVGGWIRQ